MAEARPVLAIRIPRPWTSEEEFLQQEIDTVSRNGILLLGTHSRPQGTILRFELTLLDGTPLVRGEGRVVSYTEEAFRGEPGLLLKFTRLDPKSKAFIDRIAAMRAGPQSSPPSGPGPMSMSGPSPAMNLSITGATNVQAQPPNMTPPSTASAPSVRPSAPSYGDDANESTIAMQVDFSPAASRSGSRPSSPGFAVTQPPPQPQPPRTSSSSVIPAARPSQPPPLPPQAARASAPPPAPPSFPSSPPTANMQRPSMPPPLPPAARKSMPPPLPPGATRSPSAPPPPVGTSTASHSVAPATMASPRPPSVRPPQVRPSQPPPLPLAAGSATSLHAAPRSSRGGRARTVGIIPDRDHMLGKLRDRAAAMDPAEKKRILESGHLSR